MSLPPSEIPLGAIRFNSDSQKLEYWMGSAWFQIKTFTPNLDGGERGVFFGRATPSINNQIDYITIPTQGDAIDFGDMNAAGYTYSTAASNTRGFVAGGSPSHGNMIDFLTFSSTGTVTDKSAIVILGLLPGTFKPKVLANSNIDDLSCA